MRTALLVCLLFTSRVSLAEETISPNDPALDPHDGMRCRVFNFYDYSTKAYLIISFYQGYAQSLEILEHFMIEEKEKGNPEVAKGYLRSIETLVVAAQIRPDTAWDKQMETIIEECKKDPDMPVKYAWMKAVTLEGKEALKRKSTNPGAP